MDDPMLDAMRGLIARTQMLPHGTTLLVAVSGGQDSCALLHGLAALRAELGLTLHAAHVHHRLRAEAADDDAEFTRALAGSLEVPCSVAQCDAPAAARLLHCSTEEAARRVRHQALEREAARAGAAHIALGHTQDDRIETVLLNILRGTGPDGLRGMAPVSGRRIRPLLDVTRPDTAAYCARHGIAYREDATNHSVAHARNRVREELLPHLAAYYNPAIRQALLRLADVASDEADFMRAEAEQAWSRATRELSDGRVVLSAKDLNEMPVAVRRRVVRKAVESARGELTDLEYEHVARALRSLYQAKGGKPVRMALFPDLRLHADRDALTFVRGAPASRRRLRYELTVPGQTAAPELGISVCADWVKGPACLPPLDGTVALLDTQRIQPPLVLRTRLPGDRFEPLGLGGHHKLQDYFVDRKVPAGERDAVPLVVDAEGIVWVVRHGISERGRATGATARLLRLEVKPAN